MHFFTFYVCFAFALEMFPFMLFSIGKSYLFA
jgi:hypothetical protein